MEFHKLKFYSGNNIYKIIGYKNAMFAMHENIEQQEKMTCVSSQRKDPKTYISLSQNRISKQNITL